MFMKKLLASSLAVVMAVSMMSATAFADTSTVTSIETQDDGGNVKLKKTATLEDDGTYTIDLEAYATGEVTIETEPVPLDIVLVLDQSGSMGEETIKTSTGSSILRVDALKNAVQTFVDTVKEKDKASDKIEHKVAIVGFASQSSYGNNTEILSVAGSNSGTSPNKVGVAYNNLTNTHYNNALVSVNKDTNNYLQKSINALAAQGATRADLGMEMAKNILDATKTEGRKQVVIMFTDGVPSTYSDFSDSVANNAVSYARTMKAAGVDIYSVGIFDGADGSKVPDLGYRPSDEKKANRFMHAVSSNYLNANSYTDLGTQNKLAYYMSATDATELNTIFDAISKHISGETSATLDANSVLKDVMAEGFDLTNATATVKTADYNGNNTWKTATDADLTAAIDSSTGTVSVTGFNYKENYVAEATSMSSATGKKLIVSIKGVTLADDVTVDQVINTNDASSGVYANSSSTTPAVAFGQPKTEVLNKAYVLDYAKTVTFNTEDDRQKVTKLSSTTEKNATLDTSSLSYGSASVSGTNVSYTPTTMDWNGYDTMYAFGTWKSGKDAAITTGNNVWSKVTIVPANNVYYDDDFVKSENTGVAGIEYTGEWNVVNATASTELAECDENSAYAGQGWIDALDRAATDSNGGIHSIEAPAKATDAMASFTFSGTGFDIYGRTTNTSGTVLVKVTGKSGSKYKVIDTSTKNLADDNSAYYQIPTCSFDGLEYGTYTVTLMVTKAANSAVTSSGADRFTFYMDGIRIYNPVEEDRTVQEAYGAGEINAQFTQVRDALQLNGTVFIDADADGNVKKGDYESTEYGLYGPKNEVYLATGQSVSFMVDQSSSDNSYYVGMKAPEGSATATVTNGSGTSSITVGSSDLYYKITPNATGMIQITNNGSSILSLTKVKTAGNTASILEAMDAEPYIAYAMTFATLENVSYDNDVIEENPVAEAAAEEIAPVEDQNNNDVVVENPVEEVAPAAPVIEKTWITNLLSKFAKFFR